MLRHLALLTMLAALSACDRSPRDKKSPLIPREEEKAVATAPSKQQTDELAEQCERNSRDQFRRAWNDGIENTADGQVIADYASHYNVKLSTCFYLLTINRHTDDNAQGGASANTLEKMLFDINGGEPYGEFVGAAGSGSPTVIFPKTCRVESLYCASGREWEVLVGRYMED